LVARNLAWRRFEVHQAPLAPPDATSLPPGVAIDIVIANVDHEDTDDLRWLRTLFPYQGLVLLVNGLPGKAQSECLQPCRFIRKPFAIDQLLAECEAARLATT
jgi:hypothetical protein